MADAWHGPILADVTHPFGSLALIAPLLQRLDVAAIIDRHLPPDPQLAFSHGRILSLLLAARLGQPTRPHQSSPPGPNAPVPTSSGMSPPRPSTTTAWDAPSTPSSRNATPS
ncbi:MAG: DUF4277 domain-containing protein [Rhodobacteraceae bacterium]|nr:DUF4277 domain-containing protein [Paracoccaceae bacterium]